MITLEQLTVMTNTLYNRPIAPIKPITADLPLLAANMLEIQRRLFLGISLSEQYRILSFIYGASPDDLITGGNS